MDHEMIAADITVECSTEGCENQTIEIPIQAAVGGSVICGPCGAVLVAKVEARAD